MKNPVKILVVDDNAIMRLGLSEAISIEDGFELVGTAANAEQALHLVRKTQPRIVTMDFQMPGENGLECTRKILAEFPETKIILLSVFDAEEDIWNAAQAGAVGYLTKKAGEIEELITAINVVAEGGRYFPENLAIKLRSRLEQPNLTPREFEVLKLLANGCSNKEIADLVSISLATVKLHITNLREKLGAADRTQAVVIAYKKGVLHLDD